MKLDISGFKDKDSKRHEYRELYENLPFIEAYAKHTDMRIAKDGPELAIGAKRDGLQDWDKHGKMQLDFLIARGLKPESKLLDFGCGTGRLAEKAVPYLNGSRYVGMDISQSAVSHAFSLGYKHGWGDKCPIFRAGDGTFNELKLDGIGGFDFIFSHSVVTHLPPDVVHELFSDLKDWDFGQFFFTYKESKQQQRSGLKQFQYPAAWLINTAKLYGLKAERDPMEWPAGQKTMRVTRA